MPKNIKKKKKTPFLYKITSILLEIITIILLGSIIYLNILSLPLLILAMITIIIISSISILLMLKSKIKKTGFTFSLILIPIFIILVFYINKTTGFLNNLNLTYKTYNYSVIVTESSSLKKINDIKLTNIGYYNDGSFEVNKALDKISKKVELESIGYEDTRTLANALLNNEVDAILLEDSYFEILNENITYEGKNFIDNVKKIYNFSIISNTNDIIKDINVIKEPFNIYVSGIDTYGEISSISRSDVNMIISVNPETRQIVLTSIPRDYYVQLHDKKGYKDKLTHAGLYGTDMSIRTLEDLLDIEINYYVKVNFSSVINIVDAIGGIKVYSDYNFTSIDNYKYNKGYNNLNGGETLSFARERKAFITGDRQRVKNQQAVFKAIFDKCTSKEIITKYSKLLDSLHGSFVTNMPTTRITSLIRMQLNKNYSWNIISNSLEGNDGSNYTYSDPTHKSYVMIPNEESIIYTKQLIDNVLSGTPLNNKSELVNKNIDDNATNITTNKFNAKLVRSSITLLENEEYIYHGYTATYNGKDITENKDIKEKFIINNKSYDNYKDLVYYITYNLNSGNYIIKYNLSYKGETKILEQKVIIKENN